MPALVVTHFANEFHGEVYLPNRQERAPFLTPMMRGKKTWKRKTRKGEGRPEICMSSC